MGNMETGDEREWGIGRQGIRENGEYGDWG